MFGGSKKGQEIYLSKKGQEIYLSQQKGPGDLSNLSLPFSPPSPFPLTVNHLRHLLPSSSLRPCLSLHSRPSHPARRIPHQNEPRLRLGHSLDLTKMFWGVVCISGCFDKPGGGDTKPRLPDFDRLPHGHLDERKEITRGCGGRR
jgi:hypothetical protein